jgi:hypothetical protein
MSLEMVRIEGLERALPFGEERKCLGDIGKVGPGMADAGSPG